jgi:hypothetical protein
MLVMAYSPAGFDAACSVRLTAATASEEKRMDTDEKVSADPKRDGPQRKTRAIAVWVHPEEGPNPAPGRISQLSMSVYLKTLGLAYKPKSILDAQRVGELLMLWLVEKRRSQVRGVRKMRCAISLSRSKREVCEVEKVAAI